MRSRIESVLVGLGLAALLGATGCDAADRRAPAPAPSSDSSSSHPPVPLKRGRCDAGPAAGTAANSRIVFERDDDGRNVHGIYTAEPDGLDERRVYVLPNDGEFLSSGQ